MFNFVRVAGSAAAALVVASAAYAGPSFAWEADADPVTSTYIDHATAGATLSDMGLNQPDADGQIAFDPNFNASVAQHAVATLNTEEVDAAQAPPARSLSELVSAHAGVDVADGEQECLAGAVYFESKGEPLEGQLAVAEVILNRAASRKFPSTICGVVKQKSQFSFVRGGRIPAAPRSSKAWRKAVAIAHIAQNELAQSKAGDAMFFHANYVRPGWRGVKRVASLGNHIFYR